MYDQFKICIMVEPLQEEKGFFIVQGENEENLWQSPERGTIFITDNELICGDSGMGFIHWLVLGTFNEILFGILRLFGIFNPQAVSLDEVDENPGTIRISLDDIDAIKLKKGSFGVAIEVHSDQFQQDNVLIIRLGTRGRDIRGEEYHHNFAEALEDQAMEAGAPITPNTNG